MKKNDKNSAESKKYKEIKISHLITIRIKMAWHTTYRKNNNLEKCAGIGLYGFISKKINEN